VDGMIVAASTTLLAESRGGGRGGVLPWGLLVAGSVASLAANVAVAEPSATGRVIAAWPSFALIASYELLMRQVRRAADNGASSRSKRSEAGAQVRSDDGRQPTPAPAVRVVLVHRATAGRALQADAYFEYQDVDNLEQVMTARSPRDQRTAAKPRVTRSYSRHRSRAWASPV
jgi:hypothetical protein